MQVIIFDDVIMHFRELSQFHSCAIILDGFSLASCDHLRIFSHWRVIFIHIFLERLIFLMILLLQFVILLCVYSELKVGDPKEDVFMGPLISKDHMSKVLHAVEEARRSGATIHTREGVLRQQLPQTCQAVRVTSLLLLTLFANFKCCCIF